MEPKQTVADWSFNNNVAIYKNASTSAGYKLDNNRIVYEPTSGGEDLVTVSGITSKDGLEIDEENKVVTVSAASLKKENVTISEGYELAISSDLKPKTRNGNWTINDTTATYTNAGTTEGYILEGNQIIYVPQGNGETVEVKGVTSLNGISIDGKKVTVDETALNKGKRLRVGTGQRHHSDEHRADFDIKRRNRDL